MALRNYFTCLGSASQLRREIHSVKAETTGLEVWLDLSPSLIGEVPLWQVHSCKNYFPERCAKPWGYHGEGQARSQPLLSSRHITSHYTICGAIRARVNSPTNARDAGMEGKRDKWQE